MFWLDSKKRTESLPLRVILPSENADHGREHRQRLRSCTVVCVCVLMLVGGSWRERERLLLPRRHPTLCLNGLWCLYLVSKGSDKSEGRKWETYWTHWHFDFEIGSSCLHYNSLCLERFILRERHTQNKCSQLDTKAEVLRQLTELFNIGTARNFEIVIWQIRKQVQRSKFIQDYVASLWLDQQ